MQHVAVTCHLRPASETRGSDQSWAQEWRGAAGSTSERHCLQRRWSPPSWPKQHKVNTLRAKNMRIPTQFASHAYIYIQAYDIHTNLKTILKYRLYLSVSVHIYIYIYVYIYIYTGFYIYKMWDVRSHVWSTDSHLRSKPQTWSWMPRVSATWSNQNTECTPGWQLPSRDSPSHKMTSHHPGSHAKSSVLQLWTPKTGKVPAPKKKTLANRKLKRR